MVFMRARWWIAGAVLAALALLTVRYEHHLRWHRLHLGDSLIPLQVAALDGSNVTIARAEHPQIINVFATWCVPCRMEMPHFAMVAAQLRRHGINVVGIDQQEGAEQVERFAKEFRLQFPVYIDRTGVTHDVLGAHMIPATIYIDAQGIIRWQHLGPLTDRDFKDLALLTRSSG